MTRITKTPFSKQKGLRYGLTVFLSAVLVSLFLPPATSAADTLSVQVSIPEQKLYVLDSGQTIASYRVSTSKFGLGDTPGSYATPLGKLEIESKVGQGQLFGMVFRGCRPTGEICKTNARGRDPIITRVLRLRGLESQNRHASSRGIYIHGTPEEYRIGRPVSWGCIRMRSRDVAELFDTIHVGTKVEITNERLRRDLTARSNTPHPGAG